MIKCYITALADLIRYGVWAPHLYEEVRKYKAVVIATDKSFRTAESYEHAEGEKVYPNAEVIELRCIYCGRKYRMWAEGKERCITS